MNNSGGTQSVVTDSAHINYDEGPNNSDRLHTLVASGSFLLPADVTIGGVFSYRSTMPFSAIAGVDINGDGNVTDYVPGTARNVFNRGNDAAMLAAVNAWRAVNNLGPISPAFSTNATRRRSGLSSQGRSSSGRNIGASTAPRTGKR